MIAATPRGHHRRSIRLHVLGLFLLIAALIVSAYPANAANDWCSRDPVISLFHESAGVPYVLDIQVFVPSSALPLAGEARLDLAIPDNVGATVVNASTGDFPLEIVIAPIKPPAITPRYTADMELLVPLPASASAFPVRLMITDPQRATVTFVEGMAGQQLRTSIAVGLGL